jgi:hypothetical protein
LNERGPATAADGTVEPENYSGGADFMAERSLKSFGWTDRHNFIKRVMTERDKQLTKHMNARVRDGVLWSLVSL